MSHSALPLEIWETHHPRCGRRISWKDIFCNQNCPESVCFHKKYTLMRHRRRDERMTVKVITSSTKLIKKDLDAYFTSLSQNIICLSWMSTSCTVASLMKDQTHKHYTCTDIPLQHAFYDLYLWPADRLTRLDETPECELHNMPA